MDCKCKSVFNRLSKADRLKLQGAALTNAITGFVRDDTKEHPWRYPFYAAYLVVVTTPLPFLGASTLLMAATVAWAKMSSSPMALRLRGRLTEAFNEAALVREHRDFVVPDPAKPDSHTVKNLSLAWEVTKRGFSDSWQATKHAWNSLKNLVIK